MSAMGGVLGVEMAVGERFSMRGGMGVYGGGGERDEGGSSSRYIERF